MNRKYINSYCQNSDIILEYRDNGIKMQEIIPDFDWYMFVSKEDFKKMEPVIDKLIQAKMISRYEDIGNYIKIYTENLNSQYQMDGRQALIKWMRENKVEPLEGDLYSDKRYILDNDIEIDDNYKILYIDIETDDSSPMIIIGHDQILSFAAVDNFGQVYYYSGQDEKKLLKQITNIISKYDVIATWNGDGFDIPYIKERMNFHQMRFFPWRSVAHVDMMKRFKHIFRFDNQVQKFSLEYISNHFLGKGKVKTGKRTIELFRNYPSDLKKYNIQDVMLLKELDEKIGCLNMMILQCKWCKTFLSKFFISELLDNYILRIAHENGVYCPTRNFSIEELKYAGGYVLEPIRGVHNNVFVFDYKSLYPTLIMTSNIGFDSLDQSGEIVNPGTKKRFNKNKKSVIHMTIEGLIGKRKEYKKKKLEMIEQGLDHGSEWERVVSDEIVVKELANSVYGIMGKQDGRWYSLDVAESITKFGQWVIKYAKSFFEENGFVVIYGDTDSVFVKDDPDCTLGNNLQGLLDKYHKTLELHLKEKYGIDNNKIELEFDKQYSKFLLVDKKTYTGHVVNIEGKKTDKMYTRGLDYIKKNTISIASEAQKLLIQNLLFNNYSVFDCEKFVEELMEKTRQGKIDKKELIIQVKLNRPVDSYKSKLPHVLVAKEMMSKTGALESNEIEYIVINAKSKKYIVPTEYEGIFDREYYWNNRIYPMLERLLEIVFPRNNWKKYKVKEFISVNQTSLF
jgi:DNA polymerase I